MLRQCVRLDVTVDGVTCYCNEDFIYREDYYIIIIFMIEKSHWNTCYESVDVYPELIPLKSLENEILINETRVN